MKKAIKIALFICAESLLAFRIKSRRHCCFCFFGEKGEKKQNLGFRKERAAIEWTEAQTALIFCFQNPMPKKTPIPADENTLDIRVQREAFKRRMLVLPYLLRERKNEKIGPFLDTVDWDSLESKISASVFWRMVQSPLRGLGETARDAEPHRTKRESARLAMDALAGHAPFLRALGRHLLRTEFGSEYAEAIKAPVRLAVAALAGQKSLAAERALVEKALEMSQSSVDQDRLAPMVEWVRAFSGIPIGEWMTPRQKRDMLDQWLECADGVEGRDGPVEGLADLLLALEGAGWVSKDDYAGFVQEALLDRREAGVLGKVSASVKIQAISALLERLGPAAAEERFFPLWVASAEEWAKARSKTDAAPRARALANRLFALNEAREIRLASNGGEAAPLTQQPQGVAPEQEKDGAKADKTTKPRRV